MSDASDTSRPVRGGAHLFVREGEYWTLAYQGRLARLKDAKGLRYLAYLLERPGREVHALDLVGIVAGHAIPVEAARGDAGEVLDATAKAAYRRRLGELGEELEEAEAFHDLERAARAKHEIDALARELAHGLGLGGRHRRTASAAERARLAVTKAIRAAIERIGEANPALGNHLRASIRTGTFCSYQPDVSTSWSPHPPESLPLPDEEARAVPKRTRYVGRDAERLLLRRLLQAGGAGQGMLAMVAGEPGVGKSRLAEEVAAEARQSGFQVLTGRCYDMQGTPPYIPFVEAFEAVVRALDPGALRDILGDDAAEVAKLVPKLRLVLSDVPAPLELPPEQERRYLLNSLCDVVGRLAAGAPLLLVLEDLHWADESTLVLLEHLAGRLADMALVVLATYRDVELRPGDPLATTLEALVRRRLVHLLSLAPLGQPEVAAMLESLTGQQPPPQVVTAVHAETEGNPFLVEEVFSHLVEEGKLLGPDGRFLPSVQIDELGVPGNVRLVIERRLQRLSEPCRRALAVAAVVGRQFPVELVAAVTELSDDVVLNALEEAEQSRLVLSVVHKGDTGFAFAHELIRQTLLARLSAPRKSLLHARVAHAIEMLHPNGVGEHAAALAHHLVAAGSLGDAGKTLRYLVLAGERALEAAAFEEAARHLETAVGRLAGGDRVLRADLLTKVGAARRSSGRADEALAAWYEALAIYEELGQADAVGRVCCEIGWQLGLTVRLDEAVAVARRGLGALGDRRSAERARLLASAATSLSLTGCHGEDRQLLEEALELACQLGDGRLLGEVLTAESIVHFTRMQFPASADAAMRAAELHRSDGALWELTQALGMVPHALVYAGRVSEVPDVLDELDPMAERLGNLAGLTWGRRARAGLELLADPDLTRFAAFARRDVDFCESAGMRWASDSYTFLGLAEFWRGRWEEAEAHLTEAGRREITPPYRGRNAAYLFLYHAYASRRHDAMAMLDSADLPRPGQENALGPWMMMLAAVEGPAVMGERQEAAALYPSVLEAMATGSAIRFLDVRFLDTVAGIAAGAGDRWDAAQSHFEAALHLASVMPNRLEQAEARRFYGQMLIERDAPGDLARAAPLVAEAVHGYRQLRMPRHQALAEGLLAQVAARRPTRRPSSLD